MKQTRCSAFHFSRGNMKKHFLPVLVLLGAMLGLIFLIGCPGTTASCTREADGRIH